MRIKLLFPLFILLVLFYSCSSMPTDKNDTENSLTNIDENGNVISNKTDEVEFIEYILGTWNNNQFSSSWYGFSFTPLADMKPIPEKDIKNINAQQSRAFDGPGAEFYEYKDMQIVHEVVASTEDESILVNVLTEKSFQDDLTVEEYAEILREELKITHGRNIEFEENVFTKIGNYDYYTVTAKINIDGITKYETICLDGKSQRFATVLFEYTSKEQLPELLSCFIPYK